MLGDKRNIWCAQNLCVYVQLAECSAEIHPSHGKTILRISEENTYELLTEISMSSSNCLNNICTCMCVYISTVQAHMCAYTGTGFSAHFII